MDMTFSRPSTSGEQAQAGLVPQAGSGHNAAASSGCNPKRRTAKRSSAKGVAAEPAAADEPELIADPNWVGIAELPACETYLRFEPPRRYAEAMIADAPNWVEGCQHSTVRAIAASVAQLVMPRFVDIEQWRRHATDFFKRLCSHRRSTASQNLNATEQLVHRIKLCEQAIAELQARLDAQPRMEARPPPGAAVGMFEQPDVQILAAQVRAAQARSPSPALHKAQAINEFLERRSHGRGDYNPRRAGSASRS